ncbi:MAG: Stage sporulation protein, partial [Phycisphaerales bacterium]|nr:Stage sporulation protein [Phycisphaerales bacterium]
MEQAVKRFARNILLLHLMVLAVVLGLVLLASRAIRLSARDQAQLQAESRQRIFAAQTARGIEAFYKSIVNDMDLLPRAEDDKDERDRLGGLIREMTREVPLLPPGVPAVPQLRAMTQPALRPPPRQGLLTPNGGNAAAGLGPRDPRDRRDNTVGGGGRGGGGGGGGGRQPQRGLLLGHLLGRQLEDRIDHLFVVPRPIPTTGTVPVRDVTVKPEPGQGPSAEELCDRYRDWLRDAKEQAVSRFELFDGPGGPRTLGYNLVALPIGSGRTVLVAAVKVSTIAEQYLAALNADPATGVMLVNDSLTVMAASRANLAGTSLAEEGDPDLSAGLLAFRAEGFKGSHVVAHPFKVGGQEFEPALLTAEPLDVAGRKWFIVVGSPLREVDGVVAALFGKIVVWAVCVVVVVTALLVSTAVQLIRGRVRLERATAHGLRQELDRARQIQQAWLPRESPSCPTIDVAAVNFPANHISGDFYNWFELPDGRIAVVIGDVTGHGMSAAFLMATTQLLVRTTMQRISDPAACLEEVNRQLCTLVFNGQFVTIQILVLDPDGGAAEVSSAGH